MGNFLRHNYERAVDPDGFHSVLRRVVGKKIITTNNDKIHIWKVEASANKDVTLSVIGDSIKTHTFKKGKRIPFMYTGKLFEIEFNSEADSYSYKVHGTIKKG